MKLLRYGPPGRTFGPIGPWLVSADEVPDPHALGMWLEVDGHRYQRGHTGNMIFRIPSLIGYLSDIMSLQPGDIISTGTPAGDPAWLTHDACRGDCGHERIPVV